MKCPSCGKEISNDSKFCEFCGFQIVSPVTSTTSQNAFDNSEGISSKSRLVAFLLCLFLGGIGIHRFYVGKTGSAIAQILTLGGLGIWTLVDFIMILCGKFTDSEGKLITKWDTQ